MECNCEINQICVLCADVYDLKINDTTPTDTEKLTYCDCEVGKCEGGSINNCAFVHGKPTDTEKLLEEAREEADKLYPPPVFGITDKGNTMFGSMSWDEQQEAFEQGAQFIINKLNERKH
jgi:hypothetical protein